MIIYGTRTLTGTKAEGGFHCPRCQMPRQYRHVQGRTWFTLYFIPVIPMWSAGEYIECPNCGGTYGLEVLDYRPDPATSTDVLADLRRTLVLTLMTAGRTGPGDLDRLYQWWQQSGMAPFPQHVLEEDLRHARDANAQLGPFVQAKLQGLDMGGRVTLFRSARQVLVGSGYPSANDEQALRSLGFALQLPPTTTDPIVRGG